MRKNDALKRARIKSGLSQEDLANKLGVKQSYVAALETSKSFSAKKAKQLAEILNIDFRDLLILEDEEGDDKVIKNPRIEAVPTRLYADPLNYEDENQKVIYLPDGSIAMRLKIVPGRAWAGYRRGFADPAAYDDLDEIIIGVDKEPGGSYLGFEVQGDSMICLDTIELADESIFPGRIAVGRELSKDKWKTRLHTHNYKNWIFVHKDDGILIKQITDHNVEEGQITVHSLNPKYKDETYNLDDMQHIFSVMQVVQRTRTKLK